MRTKKTLIVMVMMLLLFIPANISASTNALENDSNDNELNRINPIVSGLAKVLMNLANRVPISDNPAEVHKTGTTISATHGQVNFNSGNIERMVRKSFTGYGRDSLQVAMKFTGWGIPLHNGTIDILVNGAEQTSKVVTSGEYVPLTIHGSEGVEREIDINYGTTSRSKSPWQPYLHYSLYYDDGGNTPKPTTSNYTVFDGKIYVKNTDKDEVSMTKNKEYHTMNELFLEFYDEVEESMTDQAKTLSANDKPELFIETL